LETFARSVRLSDVLGWYSEEKVGLLLPDTAEESGNIVMARMREYFGEMTRCGLGRLGEEEGGISLLEYPKTLKENLMNGISDSGSPPLVAVDGNGGNGCLDPELARLMADETSLRTSTPQGGIWARLDEWTRRSVDLAGSLVGLVALSPVMLGIALLIKLTSPGPVLFRQRRVGRNGQEFWFLKFRTMYHQCDQNLHRDYVTRLIEKKAETYEAGGACYYKLVQDPRVTPLGKFLRTTSLDELPQFFNVLKGEMSLVGPRPPIGYEVARYQTWQLRRILEAKPGITGLWQVRGRSCTTFDEQVRLDLQYVENQSLWLNVRIMAQTFRAVFSTRGAF
jgi:lipopolysaccharide/colanic/teichoic acid biosynthesis glycosyltransferase